MVKSIVLITNHLTPYRKFFYDELYVTSQNLGIKFSVLLMTKCEPQRNWNYEELKSDYAILMKGIHFSFPINNHLNIQAIDLLKKIKPDIVIMAGSYFYYTNWLVLAYRKKLKCLTYFWSETHLQEIRSYNKFTFNIRDWFRRIIYRKFDGFWYSGKLSKEFITHYANHPVHLCFVPNLIDNQFYLTRAMLLSNQKIQLRKKWNIPIENKILITPARLSIVKGIHTFIDLLKKIAGLKHITMLISGVGEYQSTIEEKIKESGLDIRLLGFQQKLALSELYALSDIFLLPSLSDPNPLSCIEALWSMKPLLVSKHVGNYPEVIEEGVNGYVFDYAKPNEAIKKINKILTADEEWMKNAQRKSLEIANKIYNPNKSVKKIINEMINVK